MHCKPPHSDRGLLPCSAGLPQGTRCCWLLQSAYLNPITTLLHQIFVALELLASTARNGYCCLAAPHAGHADSHGEWPCAMASSKDFFLAASLALSIFMNSQMVRP